MSDFPIEDCWRHFVANSPFCCAEHETQARVFYVTGAMAALVALTGWNPEKNEQRLSVGAHELMQVCQELSLEYQTAEALIGGVVH
jgi:hypothetical protein